MNLTFLLSLLRGTRPLGTIVQWGCEWGRPHSQNRDLELNLIIILDRDLTFLGRLSQSSLFYSPPYFYLPFLLNDEVDSSLERCETLQHFVCCSRLS